MTFSQILSLVTALSGGVVAAFVVSYLTSRRDLKDYKRKKHEELYEIIRTDGIVFFDWWIRYQATFEGSISLAQAQAGGSSLIDGPERKTKAEMLTNLYAPKLSSPLQVYWAAKQSFVLVINDMVKLHQNDGTVQASMNRFHDARTKHDQVRQQLLAAIAVQSGKL